MPILPNPQSEYSKEMARWEQRPSEYTIGSQPGNPFRFQFFPAMVYKADRLPGSGKWACSAPAPSRFAFTNDNEWARACQEADAFTVSCQKIVNNEEEHKRALESGEGWRNSPKEALEWRERLEKQIGDAAAERNFRDRNMSEKALAEVEKAEAEHFGHLPEIPEQPRRRRGRSPKSESEG